MASSAKNYDWFYRRLFSLPAYLNDVKPLCKHYEPSARVRRILTGKGIEFSTSELRLIKKVATKYRISEEMVGMSLMMAPDYHNLADIPYAYIDEKKQKVVIELPARIKYKDLRWFFNFTVKDLQKKLGNYAGRKGARVGPKYADFLFAAYVMRLNNLKPSAIENELKSAATNIESSRYLSQLSESDLPDYTTEDIRKALERNLPREVKARL